jgi:LacI family transcriptional regulator
MVFMNPTITDVAHAAGVAIKTVSRVLNGEPSVKAKTRERVMSAVTALNYRPNISARSLAASRSFLIALFFDNPSTGYVTEFQLGAIKRCREAGFHLTVEPVDSTAADLEQMIGRVISTLRVDGVILTPPVTDNPVVLQALHAARTPYVRITPEQSAGRAPEIHMDDARAAYAMTTHLLDLGHRDIAFIKGHPNHGASGLRGDGFLKAMADRGLPVREHWVQQGYFSFRSGFECAEALLSGTPRPTAIFASNDDMALGVMAMAYRHGLNIPRDLSIAGFDDTPAASVMWPQLTTVRQPIFDMGAAAADLIISGKAKRALEGDVPKRRVFDFVLVPRESTAPPAG